ncbi:major facilitator superfamily domain-containing protein [Microdochium trichocladiopsis]|uniref:Major facilitator superfamily domain-containing protein n=1 Tax=Microdochium trichocladiopsis TaxID=1682393 RepID=A0A9P8YFZ1_9PEZI|nr:major facilitator superfamily domain-containing protein [Microdochium trichocladiopsis]KAH7039560.1 major facilitator superfamily domain-containing protein [Microdochium trichocladiopsis]
MAKGESHIEVDPRSGDPATVDVPEKAPIALEEEPAAAYLRVHSEWADYEPSEAGAVLRKIDWRLMPLIIGTITIAAVDKILISNAALYGMTTDTHLVGQQYSWEVPVGKTVGAAVVVWGILVMCLGAAQNAAGLMVLRFLMGVFEAPLFPAVTILNTMWYKKQEQPVRMAITFMAFSSLVTGVVSYGIGNAQTAIASWRLLFLVVGGFTLLWGVVLLLWLPDSPLKDNFLKGKDKFIALDRVRENMTGVDNQELKWYQVREAFTDYKTYLLFVFFLCMNVPTGGLVTFAAQIVSGLGYGKLETTLLGMPTGMVQSFAGLMVAIPQRWLKNKRCISAALCCLVPLACSILIRMLSSGNKVGRLLAYYFFYFFWGPYATVLSLPMANVSGHTKKLTINATVFLAYCIANIIGPQVFIAAEAPNYTTGYNAILGFEIVAIASLAAYAIGCRIENNRRDEADGSGVSVSMEEQLGDLTDY